MLKKLSVFIICFLFLPFFQTCSDRSYLDSGWLHKKEVPTNEFVLNKEGIQVSNYSFEEIKIKNNKAVAEFIKLRKEKTFSGYRLAIFLASNSADFPWAFLPFFLLLLINFIIMYYAFKEKPKITFFLAITNLVLLLSTILLFYLSGYLEDIDQLKAGFYLLLFNLILTTLESNSNIAFSRKSLL